MKNLKQLTLQFHGANLSFSPNMITPHTLERLCFDIGKKMKNLECLTLDFSQISYLNVNPSLVKFMTKHLTASLNKLQTLNIICTSMLKEGVQDISFDKRYLQKLQHLAFYLNDKGADSDDLRNFILGPKSIKQIPHSLTFSALDIGPYSGIEMCVESIATNILNNVKSLKALELSFDSVFPEESVEKPFQYIEILNKLIPQLESLKLKFTKCIKVDVKILENLKCEQTNCLKKFELSMSSRSIDKDEDEYVPEHILQRYGRKSDSAKFVQSFCSSFLQNLKNLTLLKMELSCLEMTDLDINTLGSCITNKLGNLSSLDLTFFWIPTITNEVFHIMESTLTSCPFKNLQNLSLSFSYCAHLTEGSFSKLESTLQNSLNHLNSLKLKYDDYGSDGSSWIENDAFQTDEEDLSAEDEDVYEYEEIKGEIPINKYVVNYQSEDESAKSSDSEE